MGIASTWFHGSWLPAFHIKTNQFRSWPSASSTHCCCLKVQSVNAASNSCQSQQTACWCSDFTQINTSCFYCHAVTGGRANNGEGVGPSGAGVVGVGVRTLNEAGTVGQWAREQVELFCISKLINCVLEPDEEWVFLDFHFAMRKLSWLTCADCLLLLHCYCQLSLRANSPGCC